MEITDFEFYKVPPRWLFLKLETSDGTVGWGEPLIEGHTKAVQGATEDFIENYLLGQNPLKIEEHWQAMYRSGFYRGGPVLMSAISGIDQALWDIKGKHHDLPIYELFGGQCREHIRIYKWIGGNRPEDLINEAEQLIEKGYTAIKMDVAQELYHIDTLEKVKQVVNRIQRVREAVGDDIDICVDFHGRVSKPMAKRLAVELEPTGPMFIEEPVLPMNNEHLAEVAAHSTIPIATGERMYSRWDVKHVFKSGTVDVIQPNVSHAGGISELVKISNMAESHGVTVSPTCNLGPIALAASIQVGACIPNLLIQENEFNISNDSLANEHEYLKNPSVITFTNGSLNIPEESGLGIQIDEQAVEEKAQSDIEWKNPRWRHDDGSIAEW